MARQYKRTYEMIITPTDGEVRVIRNLRLSFEITKSVLGFPNLAKLVLYNPNDDTLTSLQKKFTQVVINAGYEGDVRLLFKGEIRNVFLGRQATETLATVYAGDGERDWQNATFNKTFSANVSIRAVVDELLKSFTNLTVGTVEGVPDIADKLLGQTLSGSSKDILNQYAKEYGFNWSIQDGEIIVTPIESALKTNEAVLVNAATGMINTPVITEIGANVTTLLNPRMLPNNAFKIESLGSDIQIGALFFRNVPRTRAEGLYKIQEVVFRGDSREGDWTSMVKGLTINGG